MNLWYLFAAYLAIWIGLWIYAVGLGFRQRSMRQEIESLKRWIAEGSRRPAADRPIARSPERHNPS